MATPNAVTALSQEAHKLMRQDISDAATWWDKIEGETDKNQSVYTC